MEKNATVSDIVFIEDLRVETVIGVYEWEKDVLQTVSLTLEMASNNRKPATSGRVEDTIDYNAVATRLGEFVRNNRFGLVETLAERCTEIVRAEFGVSRVRIRVRKLGALSNAAAVGVEIARGDLTG